MTWKQHLVRLLRRFGYDLTRYQPNQHSVARLMQLMKTYQTGLVLDIGANCGQYALDLRANGYSGHIVSFEPLRAAYAALAQASSKDSKWKVECCAIGSALGTSVINVAANSTSSSLLGMLPSHEQAAPESKYIEKQEVTVETVDRLLPKMEIDGGTVWMKIDTQGFEGEVLKGALGSLELISCIQLEMSLVPLYQDAETFESLLQWMAQHEYELVALQPGFTNNQTGQLLQVDGVFHSRI